MYRYGGEWIGTDISEEQINQARLLSNGKNIKYFTVATENIHFPDESQ